MLKQIVSNRILELFNCVWTNDFQIELFVIHNNIQDHLIVSKWKKNVENNN